MKDIRLIIVPDVHGRPFWKKAAESCGDTPVVFLGDYLDPYADEGISNGDAWRNLTEIMEFRSEHPDTVHLLLGNHDMGYLDRTINSCRRDWENAGRNRLFLRHNLDLFDMAHEAVAGGRRFLLTHAGVNRMWFRHHFGDDAHVCADLFNGALHGDGFGPLCKALRNVSVFRGGDWPFGSMVWADVDEFTDPGAAIPGVVQVFGHTYQGDGKWSVIGMDEAYCLDCMRVFALDGDGRIDVL